MTKRPKDHRLREFSEVDARSFAIERLRAKFNTFEEVWLRSPIGERFRIDAIALCPNKTFLVGIEFKSSHLAMSEFSDALRQCINYRDSSVEDDRFPLIDGQRLNCCIVFPDWNGLHDDGTIAYSKEASGMRVLAAHFRVGVLSRTQIKGAISFVLGNQGVWHSTTGWTGNAAGLLAGKRRRGSGSKQHD